MVSSRSLSSRPRDHNRVTRVTMAQAAATGPDDAPGAGCAAESSRRRSRMVGARKGHTMGRVRSLGLRASRGIGWRLTLAGTRLSARAVTEGEVEARGESIDASSLLRNGWTAPPVDALFYFPDTVSKIYQIEQWLPVIAAHSGDLNFGIVTRARSAWTELMRQRPAGAELPGDALPGAHGPLPGAAAEGDHLPQQRAAELPVADLARGRAHPRQPRRVRQGLDGVQPGQGLRQGVRRRRGGRAPAPRRARGLRRVDAGEGRAPAAGPQPGAHPAREHAAGPSSTPPRGRARTR